MSPRSTEFMQAAHRRLGAATVAIDADPSTALSAAYYAMLYAARAALSERDIYAKTHRGTWYELQRAFVDSGELDPELATAVRNVQRNREQADYDAWPAPTDNAMQAIELARQFLETIEALLA